MHRALEISEANTTQLISNSSGNFRELLTCSRFQKTGSVRSRYPNRAVTLIEQSLHAIKLLQSLPHVLKISGYATVGDAMLLVLSNVLHLQLVVLTSTPSWSYLT